MTPSAADTHTPTPPPGTPPGASGASAPPGTHGTPPGALDARARRTFRALNGVMFQGALSDNIFKFLLMLMVIGMANQRHPADAVRAMALANTYQLAVEILFTLPFVLAVSLAGWMSDRFSKTRVTQGTKAMEIGTMVLATLSFALGWPWVSVALLFLMGTQSALFSPSKYGLLPEILPGHRVAWGNGILQGFTFLAIILGTFVGPDLFGRFEDRLWIPGAILVGLAVVGFGISTRMAATPAAAPDERFAVNPVRPVLLYGRAIFADVGLRWSVVGMVTWWLVAVSLQGAAVLIATQILGLSPTQTGLALLPVVVGIALGCMATGLISRNRIELGLVPLGALAMCLTGALVWAATPHPEALEALTPEEFRRLRFLLPALMGLVGLSCGFFIVPLQSFFLQTCDPSIRGGAWATHNVLTALGMALGIAMKAVVVGATASPGLVFLVGAVLMLITGSVIFYRFPAIPVRFLVGVLFRAFYRVRVTGLENLPTRGGALVIANHQSYLDAILLSSLTDRQVRFLMAIDMYRKWYVWPFARAMGSIPISGRFSPRELIRSLRTANDAIANGELVAIFPEGQVTRIGMLQTFQRGYTRVVRHLDEPIIPVAIDGAYDTAYGLRGGRMRFRWRNPFRRTPINIAVGTPMPPDTTPDALHREVMNLMVAAFAFRKEDAQPLHREALRALRTGARTPQFADHASDGMISRAKLLAATVALGSRLRSEWTDEETVGILLPPSVGAVATNLAVTLAGRIAVNLNYTLSLSVLDSIRETAGLRLVITSRKFIEKAKLQLPDGLRIVYLEDVRKTIKTTDRLAALLRGRFLKIEALERYLGRRRPATLDDIVTLIFSSGSTGTPKGIPLTHWNLGANCTGAWQQIAMPEGARLLGVLPFFHSFGYMVALWLPLLKGFGIVLYPNPLDARSIGFLCEHYRITHFFGTPTFLSVYARRVQPGQFGSLTFVITGAEKLRASVAEAFARKFGIAPIEGYGATECSPVVSMSTQDYRAPGLFQAGHKPGSIGHPLPGVGVRIVDLDTGEEQPPGEPGMMLVRGPNVMGGYYRMPPEKTAEVFRDGWYVTGDVAKIDEDGFLFITDRLSRFSKIAGEMVPHLKVEEALHDLAASEETEFVVTGVPDEKKGERLVVFYSIAEDKARELAERLQKSDLPALWLPKWNDFHSLPEIPTLGTGKTDLKAINDLARERSIYTKL